MPLERSEVAVAELDGKIYVIGGFDGQQELEIYDPAVDRWSRGAAIPRALHHAGAVGLNSKLYVIGGYANGWDPTDTVYEYDPAGDRWRSLAAMPTPRGALAVAVMDDKIHAVGGSGNGRRNTPAHEVYDPLTDRWRGLAPLPTPRDHLAAATLNGRLYAIGGRVDGSYSRNLAANESYDPVADRWEARKSLPTPRSGRSLRCRRRSAAGLSTARFKTRHPTRTAKQLSRTGAFVGGQPDPGLTYQAGVGISGISRAGGSRPGRILQSLNRRVRGVRRGKRIYLWR